MINYVCPLGNRICDCDPDAANPNSRPCTLARRIAKLVRLMLGTDFDGETVSAVSRLRSVLEKEELDLATLIEQKRYTEDEAKQIYKCGIEKGHAEEADKQQAPPEFYDADGYPRWSEIALFCQHNIARLRDDREKQFVNDMAGKLMWREPTERQGKWLFSIFVRLDGKYNAKTVRFRW